MAMANSALDQSLRSGVKKVCGTSVATPTVLTSRTLRLQSGSPLPLAQRLSQSHRTSNRAGISVDCWENSTPGVWPFAGRRREHAMSEAPIKRPEDVVVMFV